MSKHKLPIILLFILLISLALVGCQGQVQQAVEEAAPTVAAAVEEVAPTVEAAVEEAMEPTAEPTEEPAAEPTEEPAAEPTEEPAAEPTEAAAEEEMAMEVPDLSGVEIDFWHVWGTGSASEGLQAIVDEFNSTNPYGFTVNPVDQGNQGDLEEAVNAAIASGDLPNVTPGFANSLANWHSVGVIKPVNEYLDNPDLTIDVSDLYEGPYGQGTLPDGSQIGIPIHQSANVLTWNKTWAEELGFDAPPATAAEFKEQACAATEANATDDDPDNDGTGGLVYYPGASNIASWVYAFGGDIVNETGDGYDLNSQTMLDVAMFLKDLQDSGCTFATDSYPNPEFATRKAMFTMTSTAGIPFQLAAFEDAGNDDEWLLIPFVGPDGNQAVNAFGQLIGIVNTSEEEDLASWLWIRHFTSPEIQAQWIEASAYFPSQRATVPLIADYAAANPLWNQGLELSALGKSEPNIPAHGSVRGAIEDAFFAIAEANDEAAVQVILDELQVTAQELVDEIQ
ncbi:MAG: extracellular solute-binding protein [Candidatus Promineifilaceae bacterium]|jgi:multiple sugar transport system substrate-binding protein